ncbi:hypothetical protein HNV11_04490 [Spirosoma taeanense]|uniref:ThuA domain-containing protein n=1 Tax=Spirosoma taeanense TaxID=2735870 RepID=A0A6M5Y5J0_9BACT|nr:hypothetical protein [Spirosoma taeanense]QJW88686.1 hypothetical protein HNV11_04490 [Spirosoma taeanense]
MQTIGLIFNGVWSQYAMATAPKYRAIYKLIYVHDLSDAAVEGLEALVVPFQSNQQELARQKEVMYNFLKQGKKVFVEGDSTADWLDAQWEDRPVNNYWWVESPNNPPVSATNYNHPIYQGLTPRQACWHTHGVYTRIPAHAGIVQSNPAGEIISWETHDYGGTLFVTTLDPIVEHGVQQISHLDNYVDRLTEWLSGVKPAPGRMTVDKALYGAGALV